MTHTIRPARPDDYDRIAAVADDWWGRPILAILPRLFLDHFHRTSRVAETAGELRGFVIGFGSPSEPDRWEHQRTDATVRRGEGWNVTS